MHLEKEEIIGTICLHKNILNDLELENFRLVSDLKEHEV